MNIGLEQTNNFARSWGTEGVDIGGCVDNEIQCECWYD